MVRKSLEVPVGSTVEDEVRIIEETRRTKKFEPELLVPDLARANREGGTGQEFWFWLGITQDCPVGAVDIAGVHFPKMQELLTDDPLGGPQRRRIPVIGGLRKITKREIDMLLEAIPRTVVRFTDDLPVSEELGTGKNVGDAHERARKGHLITIPRKEDIAAREAANRAAHHYTPSPRDVPAARFMFMHLCKDQSKGERGYAYPDTLDKSGIEWPEND